MAADACVGEDLPPRDQEALDAELRGGPGGRRASEPAPRAQAQGDELRRRSASDPAPVDARGQPMCRAGTDADAGRDVASGSRGSRADDASVRDAHQEERFELHSPAPVQPASPYEVLTRWQKHFPRFRAPPRKRLPERSRGEHASQPGHPQQEGAKIARAADSDEDAASWWEADLDDVAIGWPRRPPLLPHVCHFEPYLEPRMYENGAKRELAIETDSAADGTPPASAPEAVAVPESPQASSPAAPATEGPGLAEEHEEEEEEQALGPEVSAPHTAPAPPTAEVIDGSRVRVEWLPADDVPEAIGYALALHDGSMLRYYHPQAGVLVVSAEGLQPIPAGTTSVVVRGLTAGLRYTPALAVGSALGWSAYSALGKPAVLEPPVAPARPDASVADEHSIRLAWTSPESDEAPEISGYGVCVAVAGACLLYYDSDSGSLLPDPVHAHPLPASARELVIGKLSAGLRYRFRVAAMNRVGWGPYSPLSAAASIGPPPPPLGRPGVRILSRTSVQVTWADVEHTPEVTGYALVAHQGGAVWYYDGGKGALVREGGDLEPLRATATFACIQGLVPSSKYRFAVAAQCRAGWGAYSPSSDAVVLAPPPAPAAPSMEALGEGRLCIRWEAVPPWACADGYAVTVSDGRATRFVDPRMGALVDAGEGLQPLPAGQTSCEVVLTADTGAPLKAPACYRARVAARNGAGWGKYSSGSERLLLDVPAPPTCVLVRQIDSAFVRVSWEAALAQPPAFGYLLLLRDGAKVWRYHAGRGDLEEEEEGQAAADNTDPAGFVPASIRSVPIGGLAAGVAYQAQVAAINDLGVGAGSLWTEAVVLAQTEDWRLWPPLRMDLAPGIPVPRTFEASRYRALRLRTLDVTGRCRLEDGFAWALDCAGASRAAARHREALGSGLPNSQALPLVWLTEGGMDARSLYVELNRVLLEDDEVELQKWGWALEVLERHLARCPPQVTSVAWRGSKLTRRQAGSLRAGEVIRPPMFVAASQDRSEAAAFQDLYLVRFEVPAFCSGVGVLDDGPAPGRVVVLAPYTPLRVLSVGEDLVEVEVLHAAAASELLEGGGGAAPRAFPI